MDEGLNFLSHTFSPFICGHCNPLFPYFPGKTNIFLHYIPILWQNQTDFSHLNPFAGNSRSPETFFSTFWQQFRAFILTCVYEKNRKTPAETSGLIKVSAAIPSAVNKIILKIRDCSFPRTGSRTTIHKRYAASA